MFLNYGALAQLARAFDWQSRGQRFDSAMLHNKNDKQLEVNDLELFVFLFSQ